MEIQIQNILYYDESTMMNSNKSLLVLFLVTIFIKHICTIIDTIIVLCLQDSFVIKSMMDAHVDYKSTRWTKKVPIKVSQSHSLAFWIFITILLLTYLLFVFGVVSM